jgi:Protein of unknown function (DUF3486)
MPQVRAIDLLPIPVKSQLDERLIQSGFGGYIGLSEWLKEQGFEISKSSIGEYGKDFKDRLAALKLSREMAIAYRQALPDDQGAQAEMLGELAQDVLFNFLLKVQDFTKNSGSEEESEELKKLSSMIATTTRAVADVSRSGIAVKKYASEVKCKVVALEGKPGMDATTLEAVRREIFGG